MSGLFVRLYQILYHKEIGIGSTKLFNHIISSAVPPNQSIRRRKPNPRPRKKLAWNTSCKYIMKELGNCPRIYMANLSEARQSHIETKEKDLKGV